MGEREKMPTEKKTNVKNSVGRLIVAALSVLIQASWLVLLGMGMDLYPVWISTGTRLLALVIALRIYGKQTNAAIKMAWIFLILTLPILGISCYLIVGRSKTTIKMRRRYAVIDAILGEELPQDPQVFQKLEQADLAIANQCRYLRDFGKYPVYQNTDATFYPSAEEGLEAQKEALRSAKHFIFMEYHAIEIAEAFEGVHQILVEKAKQGVEVRIFYDDVGSIGFLNPEFIRRMEADGIQCKVFNPVFPIWNLFMNNRDHRKIMVIDGRSGFTGGLD